MNLKDPKLTALQLNEYINNQDIYVEKIELIFFFFRNCNKCEVKIYNKILLLTFTYKNFILKKEK